MRAHLVTPRRTAAAVAVAMLTTLMPFFVAPSASAAPTRYVTVSDGTSIALNVRMPNGHRKGQRHPVLFEMSGYDGGSSDGTTPGGVAGEGSRGLTKPYNKDYVTIHASVRGTGCSGGEFDLFSWRSALDGREVIEWAARQAWSNGKVAIYGHSYGGITGFMIAVTRPPHLRAASLSGLIDDLYRGITYPGGVSNFGFPLLWTGGIRNVYDIGGGTYPGIAAGDEQCARNVATHSRTVLNDPIVQGLTDTDNGWWQARALMNYAHRVNVPIHIGGAYNDEQTGARGPFHLFELISDGVPRRLLMSNGDHGTQTSPEFQGDRKAWVDYWTRGEGSGYPISSVRTLFEMSDNKSNGHKDSRTFPLEDTRWSRLYLRKDGGLDTTRPGKDEGSDTYFSGSPRQGWSYQAGGSSGSEVTTPEGPDELTFVSKKFARPTALVGPSTATLYMSSTAVDTEVYVQLIDVGPKGDRYYLQRGMLKASHRAIDPLLSDRTRSGMIYRPHRPHTNPQPIAPGDVYEYLVEIWPLGHVFRPGHKLMVKVHTPPAVDSYYAYVPRRPVGLNTLIHDAKHPSHLTLPFVSLSDTRLGPERKPCSLDQVRCIPA